MSLQTLCRKIIVLGEVIIDIMREVVLYDEIFLVDLSDSEEGIFWKK